MKYGGNPVCAYCVGGDHARCQGVWSSQDLRLWWTCGCEPCEARECAGYDESWDRAAAKRAAAVGETMDQVAREAGDTSQACASNDWTQYTKPSDRVFKPEDCENLPPSPRRDVLWTPIVHPDTKASYDERVLWLFRQDVHKHRLAGPF